MKAGIVCCSNGQSLDQKEKLDKLMDVLEKMGIEIVPGNHIFAQKGSLDSGTGKERAYDLMTFYKDCSVTDIFDISGGDIANEILPYLDFEAIRKSSAIFWGYSDLTTVINAIYTKTGKTSFLYQIKNLVWEYGDIQRKRLQNYLTPEIEEAEEGLLDYRYEFLQGKELHGTTVGGNIRCLLKLAGTSYWPDMKDHVLVLEALGGGEAQVRTYFSQLEQMRVFSIVSGILLGTFTKLEETEGEYAAFRLLKSHIRDDLPVARTSDIGHGQNAKAIVIGECVHLYREK